MRKHLSRNILSYIPGKKTFGVYRFLPIFFVLGAALEFTMIHWKVGEINFYTVYKRNQAEHLALKEIEAEANQVEKDS